MDTLNRRQVLRTAVAGSAGLVGALGARPAGAAPLDSLFPPPVAARYTFFTPDEIVFVDAAVARLIPADELGPGAREAGVTFFIDQQLDGPFGRGETWYMQGPWQDGTAQQGYQLRLSPAKLYRAGIEGADAHCRDAFGGKAFAALSSAQQDEVLKALEGGKIELAGTPGKAFFDLLWQNTQEGFFADPIYGGNRGFIGWKLVGFPGPRYNYVEEIGRFGQPYEHPTVGLAGRDGLPLRRT